MLVCVPEFEMSVPVLRWCLSSTLGALFERVFSFSVGSRHALGFCIWGGGAAHRKTYVAKIERKHSSVPGNTNFGVLLT